MPNKSKAMFSKNKTDWSLLAKYMAGETNEKEKQAVTEWLDNNPENRVLYKEIKSDWKIMDTMNSRFNVDNAWNKLQNRIVANDGSIADSNNIAAHQLSRRNFLTPMRIAASLLFLAFLGTSLFFVAGRLQRVNVTADYNEKGKEVILPDGSTVYLNGSSSISYSKNFDKKSREVRLDGEAFFEVTPDKSKPFSIYANKARIKVLGTSFNVDARNDDDIVEVFVTTGIVELSDAEDQHNHVLLRPGNIGMLNHNTVSSTNAENENCIAWRTGIMTFHDTMLSEVTAVLNEVYNVNIVFRDSGIDTTHINGSYQNDPLDDILNAICMQNQLIVEKSANMIYLSRQ